MLSQRIAAKLGPFIDDVRNKHAPLYEKLKKKYEADLNNDKAWVHHSKHFAAFYLWFMAISVLYTSLRFTVPYVVGDLWYYDWWIIYWCKVIIGFGFVQITANWLCIRCYSSYYQEDQEDHPQLRKTLWDHHPEQQQQSNAEEAEMKKSDAEPNTDVVSRPVSSHGRWQYCAVCQRDTPPRAHHCKMCRKCTLKRDHHCFIVGACIGYYNQRYFVMLTFYLMVYSGICLFLAYYYLRDMMWPNSYWLDYFLPYTFFKCVVTGALPLQHFLIMCQVYTFTWVGPMCASFFILQVLSIVTGKTMYEFTRNINVRVTSTINENFQSVFGAFWAFNFLLPAVILFRQPGDGIHWAEVIMVVKRKGLNSVTIKERSQ